jgi:hypothetical protein
MRAVNVRLKFSCLITLKTRYSDEFLSISIQSLIVINAICSGRWRDLYFYEMYSVNEVADLILEQNLPYLFMREAVNRKQHVACEKFC